MTEWQLNGNAEDLRRTHDNPIRSLIRRWVQTHEETVAPEHALVSKLHAQSSFAGATGGRRLVPAGGEKKKRVGCEQIRWALSAQCSAPIKEACARTIPFCTDIHNLDPGQNAVELPMSQVTSHTPGKNDVTDCQR